MEIKVLARRGTAVREIARQTGVSRNTVRRYLRGEQAARCKRREPRPTKFDPLKNYLLERICVSSGVPCWETNFIAAFIGMLGRAATLDAICDRKERV